MIPALKENLQKCLLNPNVFKAAHIPWGERNNVLPYSQLTVNSFRCFHDSLLLYVINLTCHPLLPAIVSVPNSSAQDLLP